MWKILIICVVLILSFYFLYPTIRWYSLSPAKQKQLSEEKYKSLIGRKLRLGLDLVGGVDILLKVNLDKMKESEINKEIETINTEFIANHIDAKIIFSTEPKSLFVQFSNPADENRIRDILAKSLILKIDTSLPVKDNKIPLLVEERTIREKSADIIDRAFTVIENRINQLGLTEPLLMKEGAERIRVQLPGEENPDRARALLQKQAYLEFRLVGDQKLLADLLDENENLKPGAVLPEGYDLYYYQDVRDGKVIREPLLLEKRAKLTGDRIVSAAVRFDAVHFGAPYVELEFDRTGARIFERITAANVGKRLAIVLDNEVKSAPVIEERIGGGRARITGRFTLDEAKELAIVLKSGALPVPLEIEEIRTVGPTLGKDSIRKGTISAIIGSVLVALFMVFYYKGAGLIANLALILNLVILLGALSALGATLTVPGIAGIVLTVGMAVDANVLIFERIKEELRLGKTIRAAIDAGYTRAFRAILDSNVTTIIAAIILFQFGSGAVKGFAVTLSIGLLASMFTAIFVTRVIFDYLTLRKGISKISI